MAGNAANILAGIGNTSSIGSLAYFAPGGTAGPLPVAFTAEVQTVTITGTATALVFTWQGVSAPSQTGSVTTAALQTALNTAWSSLLHGGTIAVSGTAGSSYVLTFPSILGNVSTVSVAATGATAAVVETTPGAGANLATAAIPVSYTDSGYITTDGLTANVNESSSNVQGYGTTQVLRVLISSSARSFDLTFLESNATSLSVYNRQALGSIIPDANGYFPITVGPPLLTTYSGIFDVVDGLNHIRFYCPQLQVSTIKSSQVSGGKEITWPVTMTALPDSSGNSIYEYFLVNALHS